MNKSDLRNLYERFKKRSEFIASATPATLANESDAQRHKRIQNLLKPDNYASLFDYYFGVNNTIAIADSPSADFHTKIYKDLYHNNIITIFNLVFRGGAKSTHANLGYIFALKQTRKARFFLVVGANEVRATMLLQELQIHLQYNHKIIDDFGQQYIYGSWSDGIFETADRCTFMALGIDQPFRGLKNNGIRLEYASIDDVEDKKRAKNQSLVKEYVEKITADIQGAFSKQSERTIINNNYFVQKGIIEHLAEKKGFSLPTIDTRTNKVLRNDFAALYIVNLTDRYYEDISPDNTHTWNPSWPQRYSHADCLRKIQQFKNNRETLSGEYYNTPINTGSRIKDSMIALLSPLPIDQYELILRTWDLAYSDSYCFKASATIGIYQGHITVLDLYCKQSDIQSAFHYHFTTAARILRSNPAFITYYDASVAQQAIYEQQWLQAAAQYHSSAIPLPHKSTVDKYIKIETTLIASLLSGVLSFSDQLLHHPDFIEAKAQMLNFDKGTKYPIDFPDALADAIILANNLIRIGPDDLDLIPAIIKTRKHKNY
ncbi:MAG: hypothetical protein ACK4EX_02395 [Thermaurantimonas sp.]|uniref:hypothetical protein n=1 Tax=Thermaurantimonas TaxID=2681566 RepID=UPI0023F148D2|nr:hypothetical protein [Thermaurantimonas aggregans]MCX8149225.1 hypothetical protein [Thermaurantimonas aggregans]